MFHSQPPRLPPVPAMSVFYHKPEAYYTKPGKNIISAHRPALRAGAPPAAAGVRSATHFVTVVQNFVSQDGKVTLYSIPFVRQPDGTWLCPLPNPGVTVVDGLEYDIPLRLIPRGGITPPPPPPPPSRPTITGLFQADRTTRATTARAGDTLFLLGRNLGAPGSLEFGSSPAIIGTWTPDGIQFVVPAIPPGTYRATLREGGGSYILNGSLTVLAP